MTDTRARDVIAASLHLRFCQPDLIHLVPQYAECAVDAREALAALSDAGLVVLKRELLDDLVKTAESVIYGGDQVLQCEGAIAAVVEAVGPTREDTKMGKIVHVPAGLPIGHKHDEPPNGPDLLQYPRGTIWECSCGRRRRLEDDQREGWVWVWTNPAAPVGPTT